MRMKDSDTFKIIAAILTGALFLAFRYGPVIRKLLGILIKMVVKA